MRNDALALAAQKYAAGELGPVDAAGFELKLADDPEARDALEEAVRLSAAALGQPELKPDPLYRDAVVEMLRPTRSWVSRVFARRPYRGHPLTWTGAGAAATAVAATGIVLISQPPAPPVHSPSLNQNSIAIVPAEPTTPVVIKNTPTGNPMRPNGDG